MRIDKTTKNTYWLLLIVLLAGTLFFRQTLFFVISFIYLAYIIMENNFKLYIPKIFGLRLYIFLILFGISVGLFSFTVRNVARDIFYFLPTIIWIFIGANFPIHKSTDLQCFIKTICLFAALVSLYCYIVFIINMNWGFNGIRQVFVTGIYDIGLILPIIIMKSHYHNDRIFSKSIDNFIIIMLLAHIFLSIGRVSIFVPILLIILLSLIELKMTIKVAMLKRVLSLVLLVTALVILAAWVMPKDILSFFINKTFDSLAEVNSSQLINSTESAMNNWRGYEMQAAFTQWKNSNLIHQLLGNGLGKGIHISYIPYSWVALVENNEIPLLHNGFYTALIKIGIVGTFTLMSIFIGTIVKAILGLRRDNQDRYRYIILILISIGGCIYTYVVNGPIQQGAFLAWGLIMGILNNKNIKNIRIISNET